MAKSSDKSLPSQVDFPVVGLGASAGGITALQHFFEQVPGTPKAAYVVIVHLAPDHASSLPQMLQNCTTMPVTAVTGSVIVEPGHVYVIAPALGLTMVDGYLRVVPSPGRDRQRIAIDLFFRSLAETHRERAVAVVLSGHDKSENDLPSSQEKNPVPPGTTRP